MSVARKSAVAAGPVDSTRRDLMKAIVQERFGPPDTLQLVDAEKPEIGSVQERYFSRCTPPRPTPGTGTWSAATRASPASWAASA